MWCLSTGVTIGFDPGVYNIDEAGISVNLTVKVLEGFLERDVDVILNTRDDRAVGKLVIVQSAHRILIYSTALSSSWTGLHCYIRYGSYIHSECY